MKRIFSRKPIVLVVNFLVILCITGLIVSGCRQQVQTHSTNAVFDDFTDTLFRQEVASNTISLHYTLEEPEPYGVLDSPITFGTFPTSSTEQTAALENCLAVLHSFSPDTLSEDNQLTYDVLESYLSTALSGASFSLYEEPLSPLTGTQSQLPILLSEFRLVSAADIETYLSLLETAPNYFKSLLDFEKARSAAGLFMSDYALDKIIEECRSFIQMGEENFLYSTFEDRINDIDSLTDAVRNKYIEKNKNMISGAIFPAYELLIDGLEKLRSTGVNEKGLSNLPDGEKYYEYLVKRETGSSRAVSELKKLTQNQIQTDLTIIQKSLSENSEATDTAAIDISETNPSAILKDLEGKITGAFPENKSINTRIKYVPDDMQKFVSPAFYLIPTIDNTYDNVIYINQGSTVEGMNLYTTLAHEGYPGHLYQTTYYSNQSPEPIRNILSFGGYVEGWATYAEMCSYYFAPIKKEKATLMQHNASIMLGLYALADIGINYEGWSLNDMTSFFGGFGIKDETTIKDIYHLIISDPANYLKYYIGYVEFLELKKEAISEWGKSFSQKKFHEAILKTGPAPFDVLKKHILSE